MITLLEIVTLLKMLRLLQVNFNMMDSDTRDFLQSVFLITFNKYASSVQGMLTPAGFDTVVYVLQHQNDMVFNAGLFGDSVICTDSGTFDSTPTSFFDSGVFNG